MPNHVHVMVETQPGFPLSELLHSWKSYTASQANKILGRHGEFWQREYLDRFIRHADHYVRAIRYIEGNPGKAGLVKHTADWPFSSARRKSLGTPASLPANTSNPGAPASLPANTSNPGAPASLPANTSNPGAPASLPARREGGGEDAAKDGGAPRGAPRTSRPKGGEPP
jgi:putative DNA methylase